MPRHKGHGSKPEWFDEHGSIVNNNVKSAEKQEFIEWYALPKHMREPSTIVAFAKAIGVAEVTIHAWKKDPRVMAAVRGVGQAQVIGSFSDITQSMVDIATDPEHKSAVAAARLLYEMLEKGERSIDTVPLADMSDEEMRDLMGEMYDIFDARADVPETA